MGYSQAARLCWVTVRLRDCAGLQSGRRIVLGHGHAAGLCWAHPTWVAAFHGFTSTVEALIHAHASLCAADNDGATPLWAALVNGMSEAVEALLRAGAAVNTTDNNGRTPLWVASCAGSAEAVETLLRAGAAVNATDKDGLTPLWAATVGSRSWLPLMLGDTVVPQASCWGHEQVEGALRAAGAHQ